MRRILPVAGAMFAFGAVAADAATVVNSTTCTLGAASCLVPGATVAAGGPAGSILTSVTFRGNKAIGVGLPNEGGAARNPEIQGDAAKAETLTITFDVLNFIDSVLLSAFYNDEAFGSDPEEIASITGHFGDGSTKTLQITNTSNSTFDVNDASLFGSITRPNINRGQFLIQDLFTSFGPVSKLVFAAGDTPKGNDNSDFAVTTVSATPIPLPAGLWLLAGGLGALGLVRRRAA